MTKLDITKTVVSIIIGSGTAKIVHQTIKSNTSPENVVDIVTMYAGAVVIASMVADASKKYTDTKIDEIAIWYRATVKK
jgi:hypothetical protein